MSEDTDAKSVGRPQRTTRSERRKSRRPPAPDESGVTSQAADAQDDDEASSFDTLVDVDVSSDEASDADAGEHASEVGGAGAAAEGAHEADASSGDTFEALDDDEARPTREMKVVPLDLSEDDKTNPRIRVEELATRLQAAQGARAEADARQEAPATPSRPVVARRDEADESAEGEETTHPRIVVQMTSVVIAPARIIGTGSGADEESDVAPRMASRPPPPSTPIAAAPSAAVVLPRPPPPPPPPASDREQGTASAEAAPAAAPADADDAQLEAEAKDLEAEAEEPIVDVDEADDELSRTARTPPPPPSPEARARTSAVPPPKRPPPPPAAPVATLVAPVAPSAPGPPPPPPPSAPAAHAQAPATQSQPVAPPRPEDEQKKRKQARQWWERFFSEDYLRAVQPPAPAQIAHQVDFVVESLGLERGATILDVGCGLGLHCVELTRRGYLTVGLDLSLAMITRAAESAQRLGLKINFLHADIREMQFDGAFDAAICLGTTFGFFDDESNRDVLARLHQALRPGGRLLLDVANRDYVMPLQPNLVWFEGDGCVCMEESDFNHFTSRLSVKRTMMREDGTQSASEYSLRLYSLHELGQLIQQMGFRVLEVSGQEAVRGAFFGACAPRIVILAERRAGARMSQVMPPERPSQEMMRPSTIERGSAEVPKPPLPKPPSGQGT